MGAVIYSAVRAALGTIDMPSRLEFWTRGDGALTADEHMRITNAGRVGIGVTSPDE